MRLARAALVTPAPQVCGVGSEPKTPPMATIRDPWTNRSSTARMRRSSPPSFNDTDRPEVLGRSVSLKLGGLLRLIRAVDDRFVQGSRIVAIGGVFGSEPTPQTCGAGVTNAALANLIRQLADAYGPRGVTVHMVAPGVLDTDRIRRFAAAHAEARGVGVGVGLDEYRSHSPLGRMTTVDQVSWAVTQLLAPEADALHGATLALDGGARRGLF